MTCASCQYWNKVVYVEKHDPTGGPPRDSQGVCLRFPPQLHSTPRNGVSLLQSCWPETESNSICGEYRQNAKPAMETEVYSCIGASPFRSINPIRSDLPHLTSDSYMPTGKGVGALVLVVLFFVGLWVSIVICGAFR